MSRIDYWLTSMSLNNQVEDIHHTFAPYTDHNAVHLILRTQETARGKGVWKMNTSNLLNSQYKEKFAQMWSYWQNQKPLYNDIRKWWDVGKRNIKSMSIDFSREITLNSDFPLYFNIFNDYGLLWENKTKPTNDDSNLRSSAGFGIKYYSPIGPIGFTWGFPIMDEEYDIKRMFLFSIGNID